MELLDKKKDQFENSGDATPAFLRAMFSDIPEGYFFNIWTLSNKTTSWFQSADTAANYVKNRTAGKDIYFGIGLTKTPTAANKRGTKENVHGIVGVHFDIDVDDAEGHKKKNLPQTYNDVADLLQDFGPQPSVYVYSGGGAQVYYLFKEPWLFENDTDRQEAETFIRRCHETMKQCAQKHGWTIDSVFDVTRVMRLPGTLNTKYDPPREARAEYLNGPRYNPEDLEEFIVQEIPEQEKELPIKEAAQQTGGTVYDPAARAPTNLLDALLDVDFDFKAVWQKKRDHDFPSASEYDWSIISRVAQYGFTVQQCIDTVIEWRTRHDENPQKIARNDYRGRLAAKAYKIIKEEELKKADEELSEDAVMSGSPYVREPNERTDALTNRLGIPVEGLLIYLEEPKQYQLNTAKGVIFLGPVSNLTSQKDFRNKVLDAIGILPKYVKSEKNRPGSGWDAVVQNMVDIAIEVEVSDESTVVGEFIAYIRTLLENRRKEVDDLEVDMAFAFNQPVFMDGAWHISIETLMRHIVASGNRSETRKSVSRKLKWIGAVRKRFNKNVEGDRIQRRMWVIPDNVFGEDAPRDLTDANKRNLCTF